MIIWSSWSIISIVPLDKHLYSYFLGQDSFDPLQTSFHCWDRKKAKVRPVFHLPDTTHPISAKNLYSSWTYFELSGNCFNKSHTTQPSVPSVQVKHSLSNSPHKAGGEMSFCLLMKPTCVWTDISASSKNINSRE